MRLAVLDLAIKTLGCTSNIERNHGDWVIELARKYEEFILENEKSKEISVTASMVKELREMTGLGMIECKKTLIESNGDLKAAEKQLHIRRVNAARLESYMLFGILLFVVLLIICVEELF